MTSEIDINDLSIACRNMLTRGATQEEVSSFYQCYFDFYDAFALHLCKCQILFTYLLWIANIKVSKIMLSTYSAPEILSH